MDTKIIQITSVIIENTVTPRVFGLGEDNYVYQWDINSGTWAPFKR